MSARNPFALCGTGPVGSRAYRSPRGAMFPHATPFRVTECHNICCLFGIDERGASCACPNMDSILARSWGSVSRGT